MGDFIYRNAGDSLSHEYKSAYMTKTKYSTYNPASRHERYEKTKKIIGRKARTSNPYGNYKSPYYDPVERHEYYEAHKDHVTRPYGVGDSSKSGSSRSGKGKSGKGKASKGKSGGRKGVSKGSASNLAGQIEALREQSELETEAQREAARRKIEDLRTQLSDQIKKLRGDAYSQTQSEKNQAEIRGITQGLRSRIENLRGKSDDEIKQVSKQLQKWIANEKDSLERRIAALYKQAGKTYTPRTQSDKENASKARDKEVKSRADSIYKSKSKK